MDHDFLSPSLAWLSLPRLMCVPPCTLESALESEFVVVFVCLFLGGFISDSNLKETGLFPHSLWDLDEGSDFSHCEGSRHILVLADSPLIVDVFEVLDESFWCFLTTLFHWWADDRFHTHLRLRLSWSCQRVDSFCGAFETPLNRPDTCAYCSRICFICVDSNVTYWNGNCQYTY